MKVQILKQKYASYREFHIPLPVMPKKILQSYVELETVWYVEILLKPSEQLHSHIQKCRCSDFGFLEPIDVISSGD